MTQLNWNAVGERFYEAGVDRGVLYVGSGIGVPWNGILSVSESPSGGDPTPYYYDGFKYLNVASSEEFEGTIEAFSSPREFDACDGTASLANGLFVTQQRRSPFHFTYRTMLGNDVDGIEHGYRLHLVYNALAEPTDRDNSTMSNTPDLMTLSWKITTTPIATTGRKPTAHFVLDSRRIPRLMIDAVENILYGTATTDPHMPTFAELTAALGSVLALKAYAVEGQDAYYINVVDPIDSQAVMGTLAPNPLDSGEPVLWIDTTPGTYATLKIITGG